MNKEFMSQIFDALYTDPVYELIASQNAEYRELNKIRSKLHDKLIAAIPDTSKHELIDKLNDCVSQQTDIIAKELYLQGMIDRDKMLQ